MERGRKGFLLWIVKKTLLKNSLVREELNKTVWVLRATGS
jgi:hypothetical protein